MGQLNNVRPCTYYISVCVCLPVTAARALTAALFLSLTGRHFVLALPVKLKNDRAADCVHVGGCLLAVYVTIMALL